MMLFSLYLFILMHFVTVHFIPQTVILMGFSIMFFIVVLICFHVLFVLVILFSLCSVDTRWSIFVQHVFYYQCDNANHIYSRTAK